MSALSDKIEAIMNDLEVDGSNYIGWYVDSSSKTNAMIHLAELFKKESVSFVSFRDIYRTMEGRAFKMKCNELGGIFTFMGASDEEIYEAFLKGEQHPDPWEKLNPTPSLDNTKTIKNNNI